MAGLRHPLLFFAFYLVLRDRRFFRPRFWHRRLQRTLSLLWRVAFTRPALLVVRKGVLLRLLKRRARQPWSHEEGNRHMAASGRRLGGGHNRA